MKSVSSSECDQEEEVWEKSNSDNGFIKAPSPPSIHPLLKLQSIADENTLIFFGFY